MRDDQYQIVKTAGGEKDTTKGRVLVRHLASGEEFWQSMRLLYRVGLRFAATESVEAADYVDLCGSLRWTEAALCCL